MTLHTEVVLSDTAHLQLVTCWVTQRQPNPIRNITIPKYNKKAIKKRFHAGYRLAAVNINAIVATHKNLLPRAIKGRDKEFIW